MDSNGYLLKTKTTDDCKPEQQSLEVRIFTTQSREVPSRLKLQARAR